MEKPFPTFVGVWPFSGLFIGLFLMWQRIHIWPTKNQSFELDDVKKKIVRNLEESGLSAAFSVAFSAKTRWYVVPYFWPTQN